MRTPARRADGRPGAIGVVVIAALLVAGCGYVVLPPEEDGGSALTGEGWTAVATSVGPSSEGTLRIDLAITNETGDWSAMAAVPDKPASLVSGSPSECATVVVGTGGHRLAPGFRMRGYVSGPKTDATTELLRVECAGGSAGAGSKLELDYTYLTGEYNYYEPEANKVAARLVVALDQVAADLAYPVAEPIEGLVVPSDSAITAINGVVLTLVGTDRVATSLTSTWNAENPGDYPTYVHIGNPPVIGSDGVIYGRYESPDIATVPLTPAKGEAEWTTEVAVPESVTGLTMLLSVESKKQRLFVHYAIGLDE